jgi:hypothetical protein
VDQDEELAKLKKFIFSGVAFIISAFLSFSELKYALFSKTAEAKVTGTHDTAETGRQGRRIPLVAVEYQFTEADGTARSERDDVPVDFPLPSGGSVAVQYYPGVADSSRLVGQRSLTWVYFFWRQRLGWCGLFSRHGEKRATQFMASRCADGANGSYSKRED